MTDTRQMIADLAGRLDDRSTLPARQVPGGGGEILSVGAS